MDSSISVLTTARLPRRPLCTNHFNDGCWHEPRESAIQKRYLQINPPGVVLWLVFDIDRPAGGLAWQPAGLPPPAWSCTTRANGHGHVAYGLEMPVRGNDLADKAVRYLEAVKEGYRSRLGADPGFAGILTKNPNHPHWLVERGLQKLWTLGELAEFVPLPSTAALLFREQQKLGGLGRNVDTFDRLRWWAYRAVGLYRDAGQGDWENAVHEKMQQLNELNVPPLSFGELKHIVRSVSKWVWHRYDGTGGSFNKLASIIGKMGGRPRTTTLSTSPWTDLGVSRATWYRQQKLNRKMSGK